MAAPRSVRKPPRKPPGPPSAVAPPAPPDDAPPPAPLEPASSLPCLEEIFIACQKSLARAVLSAQQAGKSDSEFAQGERPVYAIDGVDIDLSAGFHAERRRGQVERVFVDLNAPQELRSRIRFRVQSKPLELLAGAKLQLANLDPMGGGGKEARLRVWLVSPQGMPVPKYPIKIHLARPGSLAKSSLYEIDATTDRVGRVDFWVLTQENQVKIVGVRERVDDVYLRGGGRGKIDDEYFVWATCVRDPEWTKLVQPTPPLPPVETTAGEDGLPRHLFTELLRLRIGED